MIAVSFFSFNYSFLELEKLHRLNEARLQMAAVHANSMENLIDKRRQKRNLYVSYHNHIILEGLPPAKCQHSEEVSDQLPCCVSTSESK